ncbi:MAG: isoamylase early set domain-containing protein [Saprospiraceae bacterium]|nr:isoamylase early set domain-containing protein [Saprospiraceae bacterium]
MLKKEYSKTKPVCKVTFSLPEEALEGATTVKVLGDFNSWSWENGATLKRAGSEYKASVELETGRHYEFRYFVDQNYWITDPAADGYTPTQFGTHNAIVALEPFVAATQPAKAPAKKTAAPKKASEPAKAAAPVVKAAAPKKAAAKPAAPKAKAADTKPAKSDKPKSGGKKA